MLADKLKELRKERGLTQEELAEELDVSRQAIAKWESGIGLPDVENLKMLSQYFRVSTDFLLFDYQTKKLPPNLKFTMVNIGLFALGVLLGIAARSFEFGLMLAALLPCISWSIQRIILEKRYQKEGAIPELNELLHQKLPRNYYGRVLPVEKSHQKERMKWYFTDSLLFAGVLSLMDITSALFSHSSFWQIPIVQNVPLNMLLSGLLSFGLMLLLFFSMNVLLYESAIKRYNRLKQ